jgi:hypothetical protein
MQLQAVIQLRFCAGRLVMALVRHEGCRWKIGYYNRLINKRVKITAVEAMFRLGWLDCRLELV